MTTQELKEYIDKVLGNNIRCLLPSYWWKKLFHQVADRIEEVEKKVGDIVIPTSTSSVFFIVPPEGEELSAETKSKNAASYRKVVDGFAKNEFYDVKILTVFVVLEATVIGNPILTNSVLKLMYEYDSKISILSVLADGSATLEESDNSGKVTIDDAMSSDSVNPVQNKAIKSYVDTSASNVKTYTDTALSKKVDKVTGKQLSTEDFTTALKTKLEGLNAFDPTEINGKLDDLQTQLDTLVSGDASAAIESFNEITAFLNGIEDSESLDSIIASIEQQIANKQEKIDDLDTIRSGAALGATALQEHQGISHLATKAEVTNLQNEVIANEEVSAAAFNEINERIERLSENVSGAAATKEELAEAVTILNGSIATKQDTLVSGTNIKTLNGESILGEGDIVLNVDTSSLATKEELESLTNEVITNEEVSAAAFNEINDRINAISENVGETTVTKEEFESTVATINESIATKADATSTSESIAGLGESVNGINASLLNYATTESLANEVETITNTIIENEEITAAALNDLQSKIEDIYNKLNALGA